MSCVCEHDSRAVRRFVCRHSRASSMSFRALNRIQQSAGQFVKGWARGPLRRLRAFKRDESGQAIVLAAVGLSVIVSFLGLGVDVGHLRYVKRNFQMAADAA